MYAIIQIFYNFFYLHTLTLHTLHLIPLVYVSLPDVNYFLKKLYNEYS